MHGAHAATTARPRIHVLTTAVDAAWRRLHVFLPCSMWQSHGWSPHHVLCIRTTCSVSTFLVASSTRPISHACGQRDLCKWSSVIKEMQLKTTKKYHFTRTRCEVSQKHREQMSVRMWRNLNPHTGLEQRKTGRPPWQLAQRLLKRSTQSDHWTQQFFSYVSMRENRKPVHAQTCTLTCATPLSTIAPKRK